MTLPPPPPPPTTSSPSPPSISEEYTHLLTVLHPPSPTILEIDILPSSYPPQIHSDPPALALPKPLLVKLHLHARHHFFSPAPQQPHLKDVRYKATSILLLFDPNHLSAANYRKRHLLHLFDSTHDEHFLITELTYLTTLLTSPLTKHAKSPTLWSHRLWLYQTFPSLSTSTTPPLSPPPSPSPSSSPSIQESSTQTPLWTRELSIIMKAGERHPRNYYAWNYARLLFRLLRGFGGEGMGTMGEVHKWCLMHPRDISGWAFLVFWMREAKGYSAWRESGGEDEDEVRRVVRETEVWVRRYDWEGESVEWFLKACADLGFGG